MAKLPKIVLQKHTELLMYEYLVRKKIADPHIVCFGESILNSLVSLILVKSKIHISYALLINIDRMVTFKMHEICSPPFGEVSRRPNQNL